LKNGKIDIPDQDGGIITIPDPEDIPQYIETNRNIFSAWNFNIGGTDAKSFREMARGEASNLSNKYTANFFHKSQTIDRDSLVIETGHQPGLSHPGVIAKYLLLDNLIGKGNYSGLNLIVDSDTFQAVAIEIPNKEKSTISLLSLDKPIPFETAEEIGAEKFNSFLDEIDSGVDVDALKKVFKGINMLREQGTGFMLVTHSTEILDKVTPDAVHVMKDGKLAVSGKSELVDKIKKDGFKNLKI